MSLIKKKAVFIGKDGSCGFRTGQTYDVWFFRKNGKWYISKPSMNATAIPYDTKIAVQKNWKFVDS